MRRAACGRAPPHAVAAAGAAAGAASVVVAAGVSTTEVGVSEALAKRPMRRDEPMRLVAMTASMERRCSSSWIVGWPSFDARLSGGRLWVKRVLLRPL